MVDCDVLQADGGTRTAAITSAYVALCQAVRTLTSMGIRSASPLKRGVAAISVGMVHGYYLLDLCYDEDNVADVDFNVAMTEGGELVEVQGTAENKPFTREDVNTLLSLAEKGIHELFRAQQEALGVLKTG
jgi:ribonuclease PH